MDAVISPGFRQLSDRAVIVACDAGYLPYASVVAGQLAVPGRDWDVLIGSPEPLELSSALTEAGVGHVAARVAARNDHAADDRTCHPSRRHATVRA